MYSLSVEWQGPAQYPLDSRVTWRGQRVRPNDPKVASGRGRPAAVAEASKSSICHFQWWFNGHARTLLTWSIFDYPGILSSANFSRLVHYSPDSWNYRRRWLCPISSLSSNLWDLQWFGVYQNRNVFNLYSSGRHLYNCSFLPKDSLLLFPVLEMLAPQSQSHPAIWSGLTWLFKRTVDNKFRSYQRFRLVQSSRIHRALSKEIWIRLNKELPTDVNSSSTCQPVIRSFLHLIIPSAAETGQLHVLALLQKSSWPTSSSLLTLGPKSCTSPAWWNCCQSLRSHSVLDRCDVVHS